MTDHEDIVRGELKVTSNVGDDRASLLARAEAADAERDRLIAERQRLTDETDKGVRALWDQKNKFMEALEVEMAEKKALIAERERLRDEIDADCIRIVAAEAEVARLRSWVSDVCTWVENYPLNATSDYLDEWRHLVEDGRALAAEEKTTEETTA